jgi:hypothetical protein
MELPGLCETKQLEVREKQECRLAVRSPFFSRGEIVCSAKNLPARDTLWSVVGHTSEDLTMI